PQEGGRPTGDTPAATPVTRSDDSVDDQTAYRPDQRAQVEERSSMVDFPFSSLTLGFTCCQKPERGTSRGWRQSGASPCWTAAAGVVDRSSRGHRLASGHMDNEEQAPWQEHRQIIV